MEPEEILEEDESLNEGTLKSIVRSILLRHKRKPAADPNPAAEEHSKGPEDPE